MFEDDSELKARVSVRGRGTGDVPKDRFERLEVSFAEGEAQQVETELFRDSSRSIINYNDSPDLGFSASLNPYRGCEHGCIYCYARPTHEYLGFSAGLDFETKLFAKMEAPKLLRAELMKKSWKPQTLIMSGITDCYQPVERRLGITRGCLEVLAEFRNPVVVITKNYLVTRDIDLLSKLAKYKAAHVVVSITSLDRELARTMEPRAATPDMRFKAVSELAKAGIPVSVNIAPIVPGLTDHEIPALLERAAMEGACAAGYTMLRLPYGVKDLFSQWLEDHFPTRKEKVLNRLRAMRGGKLYVSEFGSRMRGEGLFAEQVEQVFYQFRKQYGLERGAGGLSSEHFKRPSDQLSLL